MAAHNPSQAIAVLSEVPSYIDFTMGNQALCCSGQRVPSRRKQRHGKRPPVPGDEDMIAGMTPPFPALDVLRRDVESAQQWLDQTLVELQDFRVPSPGRPPDGSKSRGDVQQLKDLSKDFLKRSFETDQLLSYSHAWLDQDNYTDTRFDLDIAKLEYSWSQVRDQLSSLARDYNCEELQSDLARDLSAQGGDGFSPTLNTSYIPRSKLLSRRRTDPDGEQGHQPKHKRKYVPHLSWQYRAVIKSNVKYKDRTPRGSVLGSEASESGSVYSDQLFTVRRLRDSHSTSSLSLPTVVGAGHRADSVSSLSSSLSDAERFSHLRPGYRDNPSSDSLVSRDLNSNTVRVKNKVKAGRGRRRRQPSNQLSLVKYASDSSSDTKVIYVDLSSPTTTSKPIHPSSDASNRVDIKSDYQMDGVENWTKLKEDTQTDTAMAAQGTSYPVKAKFGKLTRSTGIHEGLTALSLPPGAKQGPSNSTPTRAQHGNIHTPSRNFHPPDMSTPINSDILLPGSNRCPQTPVEIRRFLGTNNSGASRLSPDGQLTPDFSENSSNMSSLAHSPTADSHTQVRKDLKRRYQKDELWRAIKSDYHYLMDEDIIEQCRSTDSDLSWDDEEVKNAVTFTDFIQQYNELMEWLNQIQMFTQRQGSSLSEKYLNQSYYEEMLDRSPRRKLFNDYAKQLMRRYPNMKDEITVRLTHLNNQWERLQKTIAPSDGLSDRDTMLRDLALDLRGLEIWVNRIEMTLQPRTLDPSLSLQELRTMLKDHQVLQQDIECHSKVVSAVLKLCERLHNADESVTSPSEELQITALNLERRWHSIWLQSLEWQCRLEEAVNNRTSLLGRSLSTAHTRGLRDTTFDQSDSRILHADSDDSESGIQNDQSSQISETSNAQTVTHDTKATSPDASTLGRPKKVTSHSVTRADNSIAVEQEVDAAERLLELPDPDTHILIAEEESIAEGDDYQLAVRPKQGLVRHWSASTGKSGSLLDRQYSTERKRRYSDSAHITIDSPEYSPPLRSKSLDDLSKHHLLATTVSSGSLDRISDDSDDLFDETAELLKSVASELRTYESFSDDIDEDEFFLYAKDALDLARQPNSLLAQYQNPETSNLHSVLEEESEESEDMSSPRRLSQRSPGERVFASPKVRKFLQLQSFSNTISPSLTPPEGKRDSNLETDSHCQVEQGPLSIEDGKFVIDNNLSLTKDLNELPDHALTSLTASRLSSNSARPSAHGAVATPTTHILKSEHSFYRVEEFDTRLEIVSSTKVEVKGGGNEEQLSSGNLTDYDYSNDYIYQSSSDSSAYGGEKAKACGSLYLSRYDNSEDLSKILSQDSPLYSDTDDIDQDSRLSLSPSDLRRYTPPSLTQDTIMSSSQATKGSTDFGYVSGGALSETNISQDVNRTSTILLDITTPTSKPVITTKHKLVNIKLTASADENVDSSETPEMVCQPPQPLEQTSTLLISLQSNSTEISTTPDASPDTTLTSLKSHSSRLTQLNTQPDLADLAESQSPTIRPKLGPRSITISGILPSEEQSSPSDRKYRKVSIRHSVGDESSPVFVTKISSVIPKSRTTAKSLTHSVCSPTSLICKEGFTLKDNGRDRSSVYNTQLHAHGTGSVILTPADKSATSSVDLQLDSRGSSQTLDALKRAKHGQICSTSQNVESTANFSILQGRPMKRTTLRHAHGSCDNNVKSSAIWEKEVGLPAHWSSVNVDLSIHPGATTRPRSSTSGGRSRSSSDSYSTGYLTPTRSYLKVSTVETPGEESADFRETIYINPSEVTKAAQEAVATPTKPITSPSANSNAQKIPVKGVNCITTTIGPPTQTKHLSNQSTSDPSTDTATSAEEQVCVHTGRDVTGSGEEIADVDTHQQTSVPSHGYTTICLERQPLAEPAVEDNSHTPPQTKSRYTSETSLSFQPGDHLAYNPDDVQGNKVHGTHRPQAMEDESEEDSLHGQSKACVLLSRKKPVKPLNGEGDHGPTPTKLTFTTSSIDNSGSSLDVDLKTRQAKAGTVYRILDNGDVVCESNGDRDAAVTDVEDVTNDSSDQQVPLESEDSGDTSSVPSNDLSHPPPSTALDLINELLVDEPESSRPPDSQSDSQLAQTSLPDSHAATGPPEQSTAQKFLDDLDALGSDDATAAVSLFDLITNMSVPDDVRDISHTEENIPSIDRPIVEQESLPSTVPVSDVSHSPSSNDSSHPEVCDSPLENYLSSGIEELAATDEDDSVFQPISREETRNSEAHICDESAEMHAIQEIDNFVDSASDSLAPTESVIRIGLTPLEDCSQPTVVETEVPTYSSDAGEELNDTAIVQQLSPLNSGHQFEFSAESGKDHLNGSPDDATAPEKQLDDHQSSTLQGSVIPSDKVLMEQPALSLESTFDTLNVGSKVIGYSGIEEHSHPLQQTDEVKAVQPKLSDDSESPPLETPLVSQTLAILSHSDLSNGAVRQLPDGATPTDDTLDGSRSSDTLPSSCVPLEDDMQALGGNDTLKSPMSAGAVDTPESADAERTLQAPDSADGLETPAIDVVESDSESSEGVFSQDSRIQTTPGLVRPASESAMQVLTSDDTWQSPVPLNAVENSQTPDAVDTVQVPNAVDTLQTSDAVDTLQAPDTVNTLQAPDAVDTPEAPDAVDTPEAPDAVDTLQVPNAVDTLQEPDAVDTLQAPDAVDTLQAPDAVDILQAPDAVDTLQVFDAVDALQEPDVVDTLQAPNAVDTLQAPVTVDTLQAPDAVDALQVPDAVDTQEAPDDVDTLQASDVIDALQAPDTVNTLQAPDAVDAPEAPDAIDGVQVPDTVDTSQTPDDLATVQAPVINVVESDSEACDGDESSEGDDEPTRAEMHWPSLAPESQQLTANHIPDDQFTRESSVDTVKSLHSSSADQNPKSTPTKRRRKRRPRTLTGSPKLSTSGSPVAPSSPVAFNRGNSRSPDPVLANEDSDDYSCNPQSTNQESDEESCDRRKVNHYSDVVSSDNDDLANSSRLSEGSNWDYYQASPAHVSISTKDPPYSTGTEPDLDIDLEPKLDDSVLQWDDELDDNEETLTLDVRPREPRLKAAAAVVSDSEDSDIEDLHYVIQQSSTQLLQADSALRKPRRDVVKCGIYLEPQKYNEWHATCQTNIKCLQVIQEHLESEQGLANLTDDDIQQVLDLINKWQSLEKIAEQRREQSTALCKIYRDIVSGKKLVRLSEEQISVPAFNDVGELESHFRSLQTFRVNLQSQTHKMQQISDAIIVFESENKKIKMAGFKQLVAELSSALKPAILSVGKKTTELQYAVVQWHKWNSECKELETSLVKTSYDIETVELGLCEEKLIELEASFSDYSSVCTSVAHNFTEEKLTSLRLRLNHLMSDKGQPVEGSDVIPLDDELETEEEELPVEDGESGSPGDAWTDDNVTVVSTLTPPPTLLLDASPEKCDSLKSSSMESGFATMDTERSVPEVEVSRDSSGLLLQMVAREVSEEPTESSHEPLGNSASELPTDALPETPANMAPETSDSASAGLVSTEPPSSELVPAATVDVMTPLVVDVSHGNDTGNSDHQTPPTVEDLAPTLPITDQEKIHVANRSKRNKRNKRKGKNRNASSASSKPETVDPANSTNQTRDTSLNQSGLSVDESLSQPTCTNQTTSTGAGTDSAAVYTDSFTNTDIPPQTESQTDMIVTADQSTFSDSQLRTSQGVTTDVPLTNTSTNQTDSLLSTDQSTSTERWLDTVGNQTDDLPKSTQSTNTDFSLSSSSQTDNPSTEATDSVSQTDLPSERSSVNAEPQSSDEVADHGSHGNGRDVSELLLSQSIANQEGVPPLSTDDLIDDESLPISDESPPTAAGAGRVAVVEEIVLEHFPRMRKSMSIQEGTISTGSKPLTGASAKPLPRRRWITPRTLRCVSAILGSLLFLLIVYFLLLPKCCENTHYHQGVFGLRRHYTQFPPH